jgi:hypothetical protein
VSLHDAIARPLGGFLVEGSSILAPGASSEEDGAVPISEAGPGASAGPITPSLGLEGDIVAIVGPSSLKVDW